MEETKDHALEILGPIPSISSPQRKIDILVEDRRRSWRNFSAKMTKMGIIRETMTPPSDGRYRGKNLF